MSFSILVNTAKHIIEECYSNKGSHPDDILMRNCQFLSHFDPNRWEALKSKAAHAMECTEDELEENLTENNQPLILQHLMLSNFLKGDDSETDNFKNFSPLNLEDLTGTFPELKPPIVEGLLRQGEVMNIIGAPKTGKSWFVISLALSIALGGKWLSTFTTRKGKVLIIDNELHQETLAHRIRIVLNSLGHEPCDFKDSIEIISLRGALSDIEAISRYLISISAGKYCAIIFDAWYRILPGDVDENDNGSITQIYNQLDQIALQSEAAIILIHHTSKGNQSGKSITDIGSGAGAQSRAADTHLVLRNHKEDNCITIEATARSWPSPEPLVIQSDFPTWLLRNDLDPTDLTTAHRRKQEKHTWTMKHFIQEFIPSDSSIDKDILIVEVKERGIAMTEANRFLQAGLKKGLIFKKEHRGCVLYSLDRMDPDGSSETITHDVELSIRDQVFSKLKESPHLSTKELSEMFNCSDRHIRKLKKEFTTQKS